MENDREQSPEPTPDTYNRPEPEAPPAVPAPVPEADPKVEFIWSTDASSPASFSPLGQANATGVTIERKAPLSLRLGRLARDLTETLILALLIFLAVRATVQNFRVEGSSMEPSLHDGQYLLINKAIYFKVNLGFLDFLPFFDSGDDPYHYIFRAPRRGDVVVFRFPGQPTRDFIKRIVAEPGETVEVKEGLLYIDGKVLKEPYINTRMHYEFGPVTVPPKHYFVLGDNRNNSYDSHSWGMLSEDHIIGQAWISYLPFSSFGLISNPDIDPLGDEEAVTPEPTLMPEAAP